jgi:predicted component of type VI protein secretion system
MATLLILRALTGELRGQEFTFHARAHCLLGRSRHCHVRLPRDATVSRQHCLVELEGAAAWVQDLGSCNGTHLNGENIGQRQNERRGDATMIATLRRQLQDGDLLRLGSNFFVVVLPGPLDPIAPGRAGPATGEIDGHKDGPGTRSPREPADLPGAGLNRKRGMPINAHARSEVAIQVDPDKKPVRAPNPGTSTGEVSANEPLPPPSTGESAPRAAG